MNNADIIIGVLVTVVQTVVLVYAVYKALQYEKERPTQTIIPW